MKIDAFDPFAMMQKAFPASSAFNAASRQTATSFWQAQEKLLESMQDLADGWFERRHAGTEAALASARRICDADTPFEAIREYQKWAIGSFERILQDGLAGQKYVVELTRLSTEPVSESVEKARQAAEAPAEVLHRTQARARAA
jgi:hypothetical protein